jgi:hypothetical protein
MWVGWQGGGLFELNVGCTAVVVVAFGGDK